MKYFSTRGESRLNSTSEALLQGLAADGGLFLPEKINRVTITDEEIQRLDYNEIAFKVISTIFDDLNPVKLKNAIEDAYKSFSNEILPIVKLDNLYVMELFHGKTRAFKDFALSLLPRLINIAKEDLGINSKILVLTATSGDTGSAAISGFSDVDDANIVVFYPTDGISMVQRAQMINSSAKNANAVAIRGNFDDAQSGLKELFNNADFKGSLQKSGYILTSANSINIGRLVPQIAYYFYAYYSLVNNEEITNGEEISVSVPTGNFGNILASYLAKKMGLPIKTYICASNKNNVLEDFINTGVYDANREFYKTNSPSMDILISSNLERYLYLLCEDTEEIKDMMKELKENRKFVFKHDIEMTSYSLNDERTLETIKAVYDKYGYLVDTHTAIAVSATENIERKVLVTATASPIKFPNSIAEVLNFKTENESESLKIVAEMIDDKEFVRNINIDDQEEIIIDKDKVREIVEELIF